MITKTSLNHPSVIRGIKEATLNCLRGYSVDHVTNKRGHAYLAVRVRGGVAQVLDVKGRDVTEMVKGLYEGELHNA